MIIRISSTPPQKKGTPLPNTEIERVWKGAFSIVFPRAAWRGASYTVRPDLTVNGTGVTGEVGRRPTCCCCRLTSGGQSASVSSFPCNHRYNGLSKHYYSSRRPSGPLWTTRRKASAPRTYRRHTMVIIFTPNTIDKRPTRPQRPREHRTTTV